MNDSGNDDELASILLQVKNLACRYYRLTGKPLGVTGEIAESEAARHLGLMLADVRQPSVDAFRSEGYKTESIQIKGRAVDAKKKYVGRVSKMKLQPEFDVALLVLLDKVSLDAIEIWEAKYEAIKARLTAPGSKSRNDRGSMGISQFKSIARKIWPTSIDI